MAVRRRGRRPGARVRAQDIEPRNPYPFMSWPDAIVRRELEIRRIPFSYRYFKPEWCPILKVLLPDYHPEFTLPDYKIVILVMGQFWGTLPGIIDRDALGKVALESQGWKVVVWHELDIRQRVLQLFSRDLPMLDDPQITGEMIPNPYPLPDFIGKFKQIIAAKRVLIKTTRTTRTRRNKRARRRYGRRRTVRRYGG